jgi:hypothetical protein
MQTATFTCTCAHVRLPSSAMEGICVNASAPLQARRRTRCAHLGAPHRLDRLADACATTTDALPYVTGADSTETAHEPLDRLSGKCRATHEPIMPSHHKRLLRFSAIFGGTASWYLACSRVLTLRHQRNRSVLTRWTQGRAGFRSRPCCAPRQCSLTLLPYASIASRRHVQAVLLPT